ncbi:ferric-dicitrate binding protein FerR (iron transport regulator) [Flavobacterium arsenatis]|uniref:Ferric-dicitrate binding protein FerR (Iron transport regulator) n=1 Tax=Flavobacterium arsenatis TaxID=1484332 RepID=A0ABU1TPF6_9FLAO|nr:FecR family protein [Flavobacterium arsenatis]MDR6967831.1 ferric-dicitrate binding protein FerR (iron transport regulator) [Flavobacterium arsenatis]
MHHKMEEQHDLAKWLAGEMTKSELEAFEKSADFETYNKIKELSSQLEVPDFDTQEMYQNIIARKKKKKVIRLQDLWYMKIAAILVLVFGITFLVRPYVPTTEYASVGEKNTFLLPDDSEIALNSDSKINYKKWNWENERSLKLEGEAFFKVAKGEKFTVNTNLGEVTVVGTQFNIKARNKNFEVECYEGKVKVVFNKKTVFLTKGQNIVVQNNTKIEAIPLTDLQPAWLGNEIKFNNNSLADVIEELERQYNITIENTKDSSESFTGTLPLKNLDTALQIISKTFHLKYEKATNERIILTEE